MKIIHLADVHLGATCKKFALPLQKAQKFENGQRLKNAFDYANKVNAQAILISGDLFHSKNPPSSLVKFFLDIVENQSIPVFYVKGNHDEEFLFKSENLPQNLHIFSHFSTFDIENVTISGCASDDECKILDKNKFNILLMHGDIFSKGQDYIDITKLKNKNIDYLALGHLHTFSQNKLDGRGIAVYSGCLTGNGFDECGEKGFVELDTSGEVKFIPLDGAKFVCQEVDITGFSSFDDLCKKIENSLKNIDKEDYVRVVLTGFYQESQDKFLSILCGKYQKIYSYFELVDKSKMQIDLEKLAQETLSFKAEFLKLAQLENTLTDEEKTAICEIGINALRGDDVL